MILIDSHIHLDDNSFNDINKAVGFISNELRNAKIEKGIILHLLNQKWSVEEISTSIKKYNNIDAFINIDPFNNAARENFEYGISELGFIGLKLHPRLQNFKPNQEEVIRLVNFASELNVPVLLDAFPDGDYLYMGIKTTDYFELAKACPNSKIIIAHFGGHHCIDFMMLAKRTENVYFDFSFSFLYYQNSPVLENILYCMRSMRYNRIFFGSDYPDRGLKETLEKSLMIWSKNVM